MILERREPSRDGESESTTNQTMANPRKRKLSDRDTEKAPILRPRKRLSYNLDDLYLEDIEETVQSSALDEEDPVNHFYSHPSIEGTLLTRIRTSRSSNPYHLQKHPESQGRTIPTEL